LILWRRRTLVFLLVAFATLAVAFVYALLTGCWPAGKILGTMSAVSALAAIAQLSVSGFWERVLEPFKDDAKFPYGPPSAIVREVIDNPDTPIRSEIRRRVFFDPTTGAFLGIVSTVAGGVAVWL